MIAKIIVKKARQTGIDGFIFVKFENILSLSELPYEYKYGNTNEICFYKIDDTLAIGRQCSFIFHYSVNTDEIIKVNDFISKESFHRLISILKQCGQRLADINKKLKNNWVDDKEIVIEI